MPSDSERITLRQSFDRAAELYQKARPDYPNELFDSLINIANLEVRDRLLEGGCATGKATLTLGKRGFPLLAWNLVQRLRQLPAGILLE
ncbi:hypothetical protein NZD89_24575 [Alicyclobacillus fastidiosus]|uniref:SAM-dependent methyltransferase n=1 Tax=Alicyclobacillus fastidiosus TaxID=392011 RepID=A0ABY6ZP49_9BACL|nr:hypothetical protein [Alicyclobacillus fastidiosus]WAH44768.1 hypothetical protein NZD89_24575 [Alicyclobacillus fastidiosus]GMA63002.1 hypothetical protein GCM10025859_34420 [Alicyclobacillus fastidiosus]